ncbi:MAG: TlpA family protein disulfide reductase [Alistipes sp.]|nr:TlpA family protein disulfide reductase [Alistipes sp.]
MKKFLLSALCAAAACTLSSCGSSKARVAGRFIGSDDRTVYLEQVTLFAQRLADSTTLDAEGGYRFDIDGLGKDPALYNILYAGERIPLFVKGGDRIAAGSVGSVIRNYTVEGSEESSLLRDFYRSYIEGLRNLDKIAQSLPDEAEARREVLKRYTEEYYRIKREQLRFIVENKDRMAAVYALYQRVPGDQNLFNGDGDIIYYRTVADAVEERYPTSPYIPALRSEVARIEARINLAQQITESKYPDIELPDMYGRKVRLSSLDGKVVLIDFWSAELGNSNALNAELKEIYERYAERGFEIYQVSVDTSKQTWISTVQEQALPWISVCDFKGEASPVVGIYNVRKLPSNFLLDSEGSIAGKDLYGSQLEKKLQELFK